MNHENLIIQSQNIWTEICKNHPDISSIKKLYDEESLEALSRQTNTVIAIVNLRTYSRIFLSKNVVDNYEIEGEKNPVLGILQYIKFMTLDHALFPITAGKYYVKFLNSIPYEEKINQRVVFVGPKIKNRFGKTSRLLVHTANLDEDEERNPINLMNSVQDIAHSMKEDFWWMRFAYGTSPQKVKYYHYYPAATVNQTYSTISPRKLPLVMHQDTTVQKQFGLGFTPKLNKNRRC